MIARTAGPCVGDCGGRIHPGDAHVVIEALAPLVYSTEELNRE